jgi:hypothetical protein
MKSGMRPRPAANLRALCRMALASRFPWAGLPALVLASSLAASAQTAPSASLPGAIAFTCQVRAAAVEPPKPSPPALQSLASADQKADQTLHLPPVCPEGQVPILTTRDIRYFHKGNPRLGPYVAPGPAHALPADFVNKHLLLPFGQVIGNRADKPAPAAQDPANSAPASGFAAPACDGYAYYGSCYYYGTAYQYLTADGGGMTFGIESPLNFEGDDGGHSIDEIAVEASGSSLTDVEMGWSVSFSQWSDTNPHLFVYHWIDGAETCYNTCAWNQYSGTYYPGMSLSPLVGKPVYMGWVHADGAWWAWFNDQWLGYISDSQWSGAFTQAGLIQWYGEIASSNGVPPRSQMGNGLFPQSTAAASMTTMCGADASTWVCSYGDQQATSATDPTFYDILNQSSYGAARYGGPGQTGTVTPEVVVTPSAANIDSNKPLDVTVSVSYGTGNPSPTGGVKLSSGSYSSARKTLSNGSTVIAIPAGTFKPGTVTLTADYTPDRRSEPTFSSASGKSTISVKKAAQTIDFTAPPTTVKYGVAPIALKAKASSGLLVTFSVSGPAKLSASKLTITGVGTIVVTAKQAGNAVYAEAEATRSITVDRARLTVTANNQSMKQGAAVPALTYKMTGFVNGDIQAKATTGQPKLKTTATSSSVPGSYPIEVAAGTLKAKDYSFTYVNGTLTVTK